MKSGIVYSSAAVIDGLIDRLSEEVDGDVTVVATGGVAEKSFLIAEERLFETMILF